MTSQIRREPTRRVQLRELALEGVRRLEERFARHREELRFVLCGVRIEEGFLSSLNFAAEPIER